MNLECIALNRKETLKKRICLQKQSLPREFFHVWHRNATKFLCVTTDEHLFDEFAAIHDRNKCLNEPQYNLIVKIELMLLLCTYDL